MPETETLYEVELNSRFANSPMSPIMAIAEKVGKLRASGEDIVVLVAGEPDFDTPDHVKEAAIQAIRAGETKYTAVHGTPAMRNAVCDKFKCDQGTHYKDNEICVGSGAKQLLFNALSVTLSDGDEVVIPTPIWGSYPTIVKIAGGTPVLIPTTAEDDFKLTPQALEAAITPRTRWLMINSPNNPTGAVYDKIELQALAEVLRRHPDVMILSDEIYEKIVFGNQAFVSFVQAAPDLKDRTLLVNGVSKAYAMTGWRIGYGAGPARLIKAMAALQSQSTSNPCSVSQAATIAALQGPDDVVRAQCDEYQTRRDLSVKKVSAFPGVSCNIPGGAFYLFASIHGLIGKRKGDWEIKTDLDFVEYILEEAKVAIVPGSPFGAPDHFRISFATKQDLLADGLDRMAAAISELV